jgi:hypothetical protein
MTKVVSCWMQSKMGAMPSGTYIVFESEEVVMPDDIFMVEIDDKPRYFQVMQVEPRRMIIRNNIKELNNIVYVTAKQCGRYDKLCNSIDIRELSNKEVIKITDEEVVKKIKKESTYI